MKICFSFSNKSVTTFILIRGTTYFCCFGGASRESACDPSLSFCLSNDHEIFIYPFCPFSFNYQLIIKSYPTTPHLNCMYTLLDPLLPIFIHFMPSAIKLEHNPTEEWIFVFLSEEALFKIGSNHFASLSMVIHKKYHWNYLIISIFSLWMSFSVNDRIAD